MICQYLDYLTKVAEDGGTDPKGRDGELFFLEWSSVTLTLEDPLVSRLEKKKSLTGRSALTTASILVGSSSINLEVELFSTSRRRRFVLSSAHLVWRRFRSASSASRRTIIR